MIPHGACVRHAIYRLTCEQFDMLRERNGGQCEVCTTAPGTYVDHDHEHPHGGARGLVCPSCNSRVREVEVRGLAAPEEVEHYLATCVPITGDLPPTRRPEGTLNMREVAELTGESVVAIERKNRRGQMPAPDGRVGRTPWWKPETIKAWRPR